MNPLMMPLEEQKTRAWQTFARLVAIGIGLFLFGYFGAQALTDGLL